MLYSYLLDPTYSAHTLPEVALRRLGLKLAGSLAEAADMTLRLAATLRAEVEAEADWRGSIARSTCRWRLCCIAHGAGRSAARLRCAGGDVDEAGGRHPAAGAHDSRSRGDGVQREFAEAAWRRAVQPLGLPKPVKYGKGKTISTAQDVLEGLAAEHEIVRLVLEFRQLTKLKSTYIDALPPLCRRRAAAHQLQPDGGGHRTAVSSTNPNLQNIPIRTELGREIRAAFVAAPGNAAGGAPTTRRSSCGCWRTTRRTRCCWRPTARDKDIHALTASEVFGVPPMLIDAEQRRRAKAVNFGIVYGLSPFGLSQQLGIEQKEAKRFIEPISSATRACAASSTARWSRRGAMALCATCSGASAPFPTLRARIRTCAASPNAPR